MLPILADGRLGDATDVKVAAGTVGPTRATNAPPGSFAVSGHDRTHAHMIQADPSGRFVLHADLGLDKIFVWRFEAEQGVLAPNDPPVGLAAARRRTAAFPFPSQWPLAVFDPGGRLDRRAVRLRLRHGTLDRAPDDLDPAAPVLPGRNFCSEILVSADGRFVYAGNRLHDSIAIFSVGSDGRLTLRRRRMDARELSAQFHLRPDGPVPLLLQPARRRRDCLPRG